MCFKQRGMTVRTVGYYERPLSSRPETLCGQLKGAMPYYGFLIGCMITMIFTLAMTGQGVC